MALMKYSIVVAILLFAAGCNSISPEEIKAANELARAGKVKELDELLQQKPALANCMFSDDCSLLEYVVDVRPAIPNMHATIEVLLAHGADPNYDAPEILRKAIWNGRPKVVEMLLEHGADPTIVSPKKKMDMIQYARYTGDERFDPIIDAWKAKRPDA